MEINVEIDKDAVNEAITNAIIESAIGEQIRKEIKSHLDQLGRSYNNPYKATIELLVDAEIRRVFQTEFKEVVAEKVREFITAEQVAVIAEKALYQYIHGKD